MQALEQFEVHRPLLFSIAYRMLGSAMEAEDMVQETYLRYQATALESIRAPKAFLATVVTRLCLNHLQSARVQRETYIGPWLPEPLLTGAETWLPIDKQAEAHESIAMAFLVLLETLTPVERAVFLLREVFDFDYVEIAEIVGKEETTCRQLLSRAKKHIAEHRPRFKPTPEVHRQFLERFIQAVQIGELHGLMQLLADDVVLWADGGGKVRGAATHPLHGPSSVGQFVLASPRFIGNAFAAEIDEVNGEPAVILRVETKPILVIFLTVAHKRIQTVYAIANPDKLKRLTLSTAA